MEFCNNNNALHFFVSVNVILLVAPHSQHEGSDEDMVVAALLDNWKLS